MREVPFGPLALDDDGFSVGKSEDALPPGLSDGCRLVRAPVALRNGSPPTPRLDRTPAGVSTPVPGAALCPEPTAAPPAAVTLTGTAAALLTFLPLALAVSFTDVTDVSEAGTGTCAPRVVCWEPESTEPREQEFLPSVAQPEVNVGFRPDGDAASVILTLLTLLFVAHTETFHWAAWPRATLASSRCTLTQSSAAFEALARVRESRVAVMGALLLSRVTRAESVALVVGVASVEEAAADDESEADAEAEAESVGLAESVGVLGLGSADADGDVVVGGVVVVVVLVGELLDGAGLVGVDEGLPGGLELPEPDGLGLAVEVDPDEVTASHF